jgi:hypothetical protein
VVADHPHRQNERFSRERRSLRQAQPTGKAEHENRVGGWALLVRRTYWLTERLRLDPGNPLHGLQVRDVATWSLLFGTHDRPTGRLTEPRGCMKPGMLHHIARPRCRQLCKFRDRRRKAPKKKPSLFQRRFWHHCGDGWAFGARSQ